MNFRHEQNHFPLNVNHHSGALTTEIQHSPVSNSALDASLKLNKSCNASIEVVKPNKPVDGKSQAVWEDIWWETVLTGKLDDNGIPEKNGSVQMLTGAIGDPLVRNIQVDDATYLFAPIFNSEADTAGFPSSWSTGNSRYLTKTIIDAVQFSQDLFYEVDSKSLINGGAWKQFRQQSPDAFSYSLGSVTVEHATADGYWVMLNPLSAGSHTIHFGGTIDLSKIKVKDLDGDRQIGIPGIENPKPDQIIGATPAQVTEYYLQTYQSFGITTIDVTYNVEVTHATGTPAHLDLSALATV
ncbi:hypothetical protein K9N68_36325 (plasmid) [Kovacikia minuta CCNUW1]|uniref:hypothetical protein n=1 Tax=Kovacikia minuta TaxID=2931930 RepID=UPI001CCA1AA2|nr:hypothetical protein [Kovacikia minuta]UBF30635.1 hypothetical protein K9N68_36325 [Kovacikia minuta CCNUW1]